MKCLLTVGLTLGCLLPFPRAMANEITSITSETGVPTDLAIMGPGYFIVRDPDENMFYVTLWGAFHLDCNGYLVTGEGLRLQGFNNPALSEAGDLRIDSDGLVPNGSPFDGMLTFSFQSDGRILVKLYDGTEYVRAQVLLQNFSCASKLRKMGFGYYALEQPAMPLAQPLPPGTAGLGLLAEGRLEVPMPTLQLTRVPAQVSPSSQGVLYQTFNPTDMAIEGRGFFMVRDPTNNLLYATRAGAFLTDTNGYLVNYAGFRLQGYIDSALSAVGDLKTDLIGYPPSEDPNAAPVIEFSINHFGKVSTLCADGMTFLRGQILLRDCAQPDLLVGTNFGLYPLVEGSGLWTGVSAPGYGGLGWVYPGMVETSQFDEDILSARRNLNFFVQGPIQRTGSPTDVAIGGLGLFIVHDPGLGLVYATRCGAFHLDADGYLVTSNGFRVQGFSDSGLSMPGDVIINSDGNPGASATNVSVSSFSIDAMGRISVQLSDGNNFIRGQILLQWFQNPQALRMASNHLYANVEAAMPMFTSGFPGSQGLGVVNSYALEDLTTQPELKLPPRSGIRLLAADYIFDTSVVETSSDCVNWTSFGQISNSGNGEAELYDTNTGQAPHLFYRLRTPMNSGD